jgi:PAS domain S-box-containing protein
LQHEVLERRRTEAKLKRAESQFRTLLELAPDGILTVNQSGVIDFANAMVGTLFGYATDEMIGMPIERLILERLRAEHGRHRSAYFEDPHVRPMGLGRELCGLRKDNTEFSLEISLSPIESAGETVVLATVRDISERRTLEEETRKKLLNLAHVSRLSTVGEMASGLAHELNQPLTAISHNCDTALMIICNARDIDPEIVEILEENSEYS